MKNNIDIQLTKVLGTKQATKKTLYSLYSLNVVNVWFYHNSACEFSQDE
jgi:hypothetical protein